MFLDKFHCCDRMVPWESLGNNPTRKEDVKIRANGRRRGLERSGKALFFRGGVEKDAQNGQSNLVTIVGSML